MPTMQPDSGKMIQGVWPLPGGQGRYFSTLEEFIEWLSGRSSVSRQEAITWFGERFDSEKSAPGYLGVIQNLGVIQMERGNNGLLQLTEFGRHVLTAPPEERMRLITERFFTTHTGFQEVLDFTAEHERAVSLGEVFDGLSSQFPTWTTSIQFEYRLEWLASLGLLSRGKGRVFQITPKGIVYRSNTPSTRISAAETSAPTRHVPAVPLDPIEELIREVDAASLDTAHPDRFEAALARAFEELGYSVTQFGSSGETDVLVTANLGPQSYSVVVDGKTRKSGRVDQLEVLTLVDHRKANRADYAVVVARDFGRGKVADHARQHGVLLLPVSILQNWLRDHHKWPQSLVAYRAVFADGGLLEILPAELGRTFKEGSRWSRLLTEVLALLSEMYGYGITHPMSARYVYGLLVQRMKGTPFPEREVTSALDFLSHPAVGALVREDDGYLLIMPHQNLALRLRRLAEQIEVAATEGSTPAE